MNNLALKQEKQSIVYSNAQLKGRRLRMARALSGLSRQEFFQKFGIATSTIDTWESGRVELTEKGAIRICIALKQMEIFCTPNWLLTGAGQHPKIVSEMERNFFNVQQDEYDQYQQPQIIQMNSKNIQQSQSVSLDDEAQFFLKAGNNRMITRVQDDAMSPNYAAGDYVGGIIRATSELVGTVALLNISGECYIGYLKNGDNGLFTVSFNKKCGLVNVRITSAAVIVMHRKNISA